MNLDNTDALTLGVLISVVKGGNLFDNLLVGLWVETGDLNLGTVHQESCQYRSDLGTGTLGPYGCPVGWVHCLRSLCLSLSNSHVEKFSISVELMDTVTLVELDD